MRNVKWVKVGLLSFVLMMFLAPQIAHATGWVNETVGGSQVVFNFEKFPLENYGLDFYVDSSWNWLPWKWGDGIGDVVIYGLYAITNVFWLLNVYVSYFIGYVVQEAFNLDFISSLISGVATNMQKIAGIDENGIRETGLFPRFMPLIILLFGGYIAYLGAIKRQTTRALQQAVTFMLMFIMNGVFLMNATSYLTSVNNAQKDINNEMLVITKEILPSASSETIVNAPGYSNEEVQKQQSATNAIRENLFELQVYTPYLLLQYGESDVKEIGETRIESVLNASSVSEARDKAVKEEVEKYNNMNMSVRGAFLRFGMTLLIIIANAVITYSVAVLTITMITSQVLFLLLCAFLPVAMVFSLFPNSHRILMTAFQKVAQALFTKMGITLVLAVVFSLSHSFYGLAKEQGYIWVIFLQVATWLTAVNKMQDLLGFMHLGGAETRSGGRIGRLAKGLLFAGAARGLMKRSSPVSLNERKPVGATQKRQPYSQPLSKQIGQKISNIQDMPNRFAEKAGKMKDIVKNAPTNAKYKAMEMRYNYDVGRIGQEMKNNSDRTRRFTQRQLAHQHRLDALKNQENVRKELAKNQIAHGTPKTFDQTKLPKEKSAVEIVQHQSTGKRVATIPVNKELGNQSSSAVKSSTLTIQPNKSTKEKSQETIRNTGGQYKAKVEFEVPKRGRKK